MRVLLFSDVHLDIPLRRIPRREWLGKRAIGGANLALFRRNNFADVAEKVQELVRFQQEQAVDLVLSAGDFTLLGTEPEYAAARNALAPMYAAPLGFVSVPGNHDLYMPDTVRKRRFERFFGDSMTTDRPDLTVDGEWPFVRFFEPNVAVVGVNSSRPNPQPWRSSGRIPEEQLVGLRAILQVPDVVSRFVFVLTHYTPRLANGKADRINHRLANAEDFLRVCSPVERGAILCGHVHHCFRVKVPKVGPEIFCAGSATVNDRAGIWVFDTSGRDVTATRGHWDGSRYVLAGA